MTEIKEVSSHLYCLFVRLHYVSMSHQTSLISCTRTQLQQHPEPSFCFLLLALTLTGFPPETSSIDADLLCELGLNEAVTRGDISYELPVPATFIIDEWMTVRYAFANPDYRTRVDPDELLYKLSQII